jgi:hypothetical protein
MLNNINYDPTAEEYIYQYLNWLCDISEKIINRIIFKYDMDYINKKSEYNNLIFSNDDEYILINLL